MTAGEGNKGNNRVGIIGDRPHLIKIIGTRIKGGI